VYKARQPVLDRFVALKVLTVRADGSGFADRFTREAKALARLSHPAIVRVFEFGEAGGLHYLIRESVGRANLRQLEQAGRPSPRDVTMVLPKSHKACDCLRSSQRRLKFVRTHAGRLIETDAPDERKASLRVRSSFENSYSAPCANAVRTSISRSFLVFRLPAATLIDGFKLMSKHMRNMGKSWRLPA
jgi:hypothetical protein